MRRLLPLLLLVLVSGCAAGTDAALTGQDAKSALAARDRAVSGLARGQLTAITSAAQAWVAANGSLAGFAADLRANNPSAAAVAVVLTDAHASVSLGSGQCLGADLPSGTAVTEAC